MPNWPLILAASATGYFVEIWTRTSIGRLGRTIRPGPPIDAELGPIAWRGLEDRESSAFPVGRMPAMKPSHYQFTLREMMGTVALFAVSFAMLTTSLAPLGVGLIVILPGFALERARGGTGIIGGTISGFILPVAPAGAAIFLGSIETFPGIYLLFFGCVIRSVPIELHPGPDLPENAGTFSIQPECDGTCPCPVRPSHEASPVPIHDRAAHRGRRGLCGPVLAAPHAGLAACHRHRAGPAGLRRR